MDLDLQNTDAVTFLAKQAPESCNCFLVSPPFDSIRAYKGFTFDFEAIAQGMVRTLAQGGVILWNVQDQTKGMDQSGTSFRQALYFKSLGLKLNETIVLHKNAFPYPNKLAHYACHEYLFVLSKNRPAVFNPIHDRPNKQFGKRSRATVRRGKGETLVATDKVFTVRQYGRRGSVWPLEVGGGKQGGEGVVHPAKMSLQLALDCLRTWTTEDSCVGDICLGSGTSLVAAAMLGRRKGIGCDVSAEYCQIARRRIEAAQPQASCEAVPSASSLVYHPIHTGDAP
jgi:site-specific DNA-methyltransferase (adenine-specific)